jgi:hypothetical protein
MLFIMLVNLPIMIPPVIGYTIHAFPLSIVLNYDQCKPWFYSNYIQLVCNTLFKENFFDFDNICSILVGDHWVDSIYPGNPWIIRNSIEGYMLDDFQLDPCKVVISAIDHKDYIVTTLDSYYIPDTKLYKTGHQYHEVLIYGYSESQNIYQFNALTFDKSDSFKAITIYSDAVKMSFNQTGSKKFYYQESEHFYNPIKFLRIDKNFSYNFRLADLKKSLLSYLECDNYLGRFEFLRNKSDTLVFGLNVYAELERYLSEFVHQSNNVDIRAFCILHEHKKCMTLRMKFVSENFDNIKGIEHIILECEKAEELCLLIRNLMIKYSIRYDVKILIKVIALLKKAKYIEENYLRSFIELI